MTEPCPIRLYYMYTDALKEPAVMERVYASLPPWRREKAGRIRAEEEKRRSIAAGYLLKCGLAEYGIDADTAEIRLSEQGKPYLPQIHFNLSHSGALAIAVFADTEIGCDVERVRKREGLLRIAERFFSTEEYEYLSGISNSESDTFFGDFARIWTMKESYVKMRGEGLSVPLDSFSVLPALHADSETERASKSGTYRWKEIDLDPHYRISCCYTGEEREFETRKIY